MIRRADVITEARTWIGTPYHHQASLKGVGCDCLGLLRGVWREIVGEEPEAPPAYTRDWAEALGRETLAEAAGRHLTPLDVTQARPGDVVLFALSDATPAKHCAILTAPGRMIHAIETYAVAEVALGPWWRRRLRYAFAFPVEGD
ncbi:putative phage cell wall peptidase, NlpC/P60 family [Brevundimonas sp. BAL3]|uniref:NlpC/P60 family protein n=1 Tax=Brevundimonas sp. BAL3 TaxID=391600 RepID=UPI00017EB71F|nr:NlpC/P60 family protein [Brevundimonas sp. BAL3]EDX80363.1 putative phage cell wall peptidase, NlpC/P60 family [Brevundimonas sp. BAL3]